MPDTLSSAERASIVAELRRSRDAFLDAVTRFPAEAWTRHPAPGRWSASECAEHVIKIERGMRKFLPTVLAALPPDPARGGALAGRDAAVAGQLRDGPARTAPENVRPEGRYDALSPDQAGRDFAAARDEVIRFAETTDAELRSVFHAHPALRELDGYQWLLFVALHTDRHTRQLARLRSA